MPEVFDIKDFVTYLKSGLPFTFTAIVDRVHTGQYLDERRAVIKKLQSGSTIDNVYFWGHTFVMVLSNGQRLEFKMGTGAYWKFTKNENLHLYPFSELSNLIFKEDFKSNSRCLILIDCAQTMNQVKFQLIAATTSINRNGLGPCVLSETEQFKKQFVRFLKSNPFCFQKMTVASMLSNPKFFNGLGGYSVTEILCRLYIRRKILPYATAAIVLQDEANLQCILNAPTLLDQEHSLYNIHYDPANLGPQQQYVKRKFRFEFLNWYGQKTWHKLPNQAWAVRVNNRWATIWTPVVPKHLLPTDSEGNLAITTKSDLKILNPTPEQKAVAITWPCGEIWYAIRGRIITKNQLGVGPADWHSSSAQQKLISYGEPQNNEKGLSKTEGQGGKNSKAKRKRSSQKSKAIKRKKFYQQI